MTQQQHPLTPPPKLVHQWFNEGCGLPGDISEYVTTRAAQWGADQANADIERKLQEAADRELEACCEWIHGETSDECFVAILRAARRPKQPSLKEINLKHLDVMERDGHYLPEILRDLRRALEQLND